LDLGVAFCVSIFQRLSVFFDPLHSSDWRAADSLVATQNHIHKEHENHHEEHESILRVLASSQVLG